MKENEQSPSTQKKQEKETKKTNVKQNDVLSKLESIIIYRVNLQP